MTDVARLQAAIARWSAEVGGECAYVHPGHVGDRLRHGGEHVRTWERDGEVVAFRVAARFEATFDAFVAPAHRADLEHEVVEEAAVATRRLGDPATPVNTDVFDVDAARAAVLTDLGFERIRTWDHVTFRPLDHVEEPHVPDGYEVVVTEAGVEARHGGERVAWADVWLDGVNAVGLFEPVRTEEAHRRRGLARAVLLRGLHVMRERGMTTARVEHDAANEPAGALYAGLGFVVRHRTHGWRRQDG